VRRDDDGFGLPARDGRRNPSLSFKLKIIIRTAWRSQPRSEVITKRFRNSFRRRRQGRSECCGRSRRALYLASLVCDGFSGGGRPKKLPLFRLDSNISERWQIKGDVGKLRPQQQGLSPRARGALCASAGSDCHSRRKLVRPRIRHPPCRLPRRWTSNRFWSRL